MDTYIQVLVPFAVLVILYILVFSKKEEFVRIKQSWRKYDWLTFLTVIFGGVMLSTAMRNADMNFPAFPLFIAVNAVVVIIIIVALVRRSRTGQPVVQRLGDERTEMIMAKSARNAFFTTYLLFFINVCINDTIIPDETGAVLLLGGGLLVLIASLVLYTYQRS